MKIDTDKYEGHSTEYSYEILSVDDGKDMHATYALVDDAPLLLAEVKKLRDRIERATKILRYSIQPENGPDYYLDLAHERSLQMSAAADVLEGNE